MQPPELIERAQKHTGTATALAQTLGVAFQPLKHQEKRVPEWRQPRA